MDDLVFCKNCRYCDMTNRFSGVEDDTWAYCVYEKLVGRYPLRCIEIGRHCGFYKQTLTSLMNEILKNKKGEKE